MPTRLGNWEVPKWHLNRPKGRSTVTKVIANDRGHLLPGVQKTDQKHWAGLYLGTYQLPKRISKEIGNCINIYYKSKILNNYEFYRKRFDLTDLGKFINV